MSLSTICKGQDKRPYLLVNLVSWSFGACWLNSDRNLTVNIVKVLGEGGFSFVYLAQDEQSGVSGLCVRTRS